MASGGMDAPEWEWWKECSWHGSGSDKKNVAEVEVGVTKRMLLKWKQYFL